MQDNLVVGYKNIDSYLDAVASLRNEYNTGFITLPLYHQKNDTDGTVNSTVPDDPIITTIPFYLEGDFSFSLGADWTPLIDPSALASINRTLNIVQYATEGNTSQISVMNKDMQTLIWTNSDQPVFNVRCTFVSTDRAINPMIPIKMLAESVLPSNLSTNQNKTATEFRDSAAKSAEKVDEWVKEHLNVDLKSSEAIKKSGLAAPLFYKPDTTRNESGQMVANTNCTVRLSIGQWFDAYNLVVSKLSNITFSKEIVQVSNTGELGGYPLWTRCDVSLRPMTYISVEEFLAYFINPI